MTTNNLLFSATVGIALALSILSCERFEGKPPKETPLDPTLKAVASTKFSNESITSAVPVNQKILATPTGIGRILSLDRASKIWQPLHGAQEISWPLNSMTFLDANIGFASGNHGTLLKTTDGGKTWGQVARFSDLNLGPIVFADAKNGYIAAEYTLIDNEENMKYTVAVYKTTDGGSTWSEVLSQDRTSARPLFSLTVQSSDICMLVLGQTLIQRTIDGGNRWQDIPLPEKVNDISFAPDGTAWAVGVGGGFLFSTDKGSTWQKPSGFPPAAASCQWESIEIGESSGYGVAVSEDGCVVYTKDGARTWTKLNSTIKDRLRDVRIDAERGVIVGEQNVYEINF